MRRLPPIVAVRTPGVPDVPLVAMSEPKRSFPAADPEIVQQLVARLVDPSSARSTSQSARNGRGQIDLGEPGPRVEVVLAGLVHDSHHPVGLRARIGDAEVDLPHLEGHGVTFVREAEVVTASGAGHLGNGAAAARRSRPVSSSSDPLALPPPTWAVDRAQAGDLADAGAARDRLDLAARSDHTHAAILARVRAGAQPTNGQFLGRQKRRSAFVHVRVPGTREALGAVLEWGSAPEALAPEGRRNALAAEVSVAASKDGRVPAQALAKVSHGR